MYLAKFLNIILILIGIQFYLFSSFFGISLIPSTLLIAIGILAVIKSFVTSIKIASEESKQKKSSQ